MFRSMMMPFFAIVLLLSTLVGEAVHLRGTTRHIGQAPTLSKQEASDILDSAIDTVKLPANVALLTAAHASAGVADGSPQASKERLALGMPLVKEMMAAKFKGYGIEAHHIGDVMRQIRVFAQQDKALSAKLLRFMRVTSGKFGA